MTTRRRTDLAAVALLAVAAIAPAPRPLPFTGVNLSGGEFGPCKPGVPRRYGKDYTLPTTAEVDYFVRNGTNVIRLPFLWEDLQPTVGQPLDRAATDRLAAVVRAVTSRGAVALLDPHNYARRYGKVIGGPDVPVEQFADFWRRLADRFQADDRVWFGLMNEPHGLPAEQWLTAANAAIAAIRSAGAKNLILVPGIAWTGAHSWAKSGNAKVMLGVVDPADHYAIEVHQYLDKDSSGTTADVVSPTVGAERLSAFTDWCRANHREAFLGEFAAPDTLVGHAAVDGMLSAMEASPDVWLGWTWWSAGPWWPGDYMFTLEPAKGNVARPQMAWIKPHLHAGRQTN